MTYTETKKQIDKAARLYKYGLFTVPEAFNRIQEHITDYISSVPGICLGKRISAENKLYIYGLKVLTEQIRIMNKH